MSKPRFIAIVGPTASGKTAIAVELARLFNGEIVSCDSVQVYRKLDIGSAKPSKNELKGVRCRLIDVVEPDEDYSAGDYRQDASKAITDIIDSGENAFVCGGTGLYLRALLFGLIEGPGRNDELRRRLAEEARLYGRQSLYDKLVTADPEAAGKIHPNNLHRVIRALEVYYAEKRPISEFHKEHAFASPVYDALIIGVRRRREALYEAIDKRVDEMLKCGLAGEVRELRSLGYGAGLKSMQSLGYKEMQAYLDGVTTLEEAAALIKKNTRHYAKRQLTWFNADKSIEWFDGDDFSGISARAGDFLAGGRSSGGTEG